MRMDLALEHFGIHITNMFNNIPLIMLVYRTNNFLPLCTLAAPTFPVSS